MPLKQFFRGKYS